MDDPYKALGVAKTASQDEIKKAYRKIAKTDHPDLNPDPAAGERFKAASVAYDLLKDPGQRARFDAGEITEAQLALLISTGRLEGSGDGAPGRRTIGSTTRADEPEVATTEVRQ